MLRFPNPSSTTRNFVSVFRVAHQELSDRAVGIDDMVSATVGHDLATSSGHVGNEAIARSTRRDRSRDPLYNQIKMYAELFRILGWMCSTIERALRYTFTPLGSQVVLAGEHYGGIVGESALAVTYPNPNIRSNQREIHNIRPFPLLLRTMAECDGELTRDEMIIGPLSARSDETEIENRRTRARVLESRDRRGSVEEALQVISAQVGIQINTLRNYTRWPIALMRDLGWTTAKPRVSKAKSPVSAHALTELGANIAERVANSADLRARHLSSLTNDELRALSLFGHYRMLERAGFDVSSVREVMDRSEPRLSRTMAKLAVRPGTDILFSPFQALATKDLQKVLHNPKADSTQGQPRHGVTTDVSQAPQAVLPSVRLPIHGSTKAPLTSGHGELVDELRRCFDDSRGVVEQAARMFVSAHRQDAKDEFYPMVRNLFRLLGLRCEVSRHGVHYQRWDACLWIDRQVAQPIEIKSPTEEVSLSTKALRQAMENKIVLLARGDPATDREAASLVVGYELPSERSDLSLLIEDVFATYGIRIGVIGLHTLAVVGLRRVCEGAEASASTIVRLKGFLHV